MAKTKDWWTDFFPAFRPIFDTINPKDTAAEIKYLTRKLGLKRGSRFLDCGCGIGRISIPLAKRGVRVTGVDVTKSYIDELASRSRRMKLKLELFCSDMRRINFDRRFDAAGNLGTSFGYFDRDYDNELVLKKMYRALKPGGKFMLHVGNRDWIIKNYASFGLTEFGKTRVINKRHFDPARSVITADWIFLKAGQEKTVRSVLRIYSFHELIFMMKRAGFVNIEGFGSVKDDPIGFGSRMMFIVGARPK